MATSLQISEGPSFADYAVTNIGASDIPAYACVIIDTTSVVSAVAAPKTGIAVCLPTGTGQQAVGFTMEIIPKLGGVGRIRGPGGFAKGIATSAITAGTPVMCDFSGTPGNIVTQTSGLPQVGIAMTASTATGDEVGVLVCPAFNH